PLTIPPADNTGAVGETGGFAVRENTRFFNPGDEAVIVNGPAVLPSVTAALTVPSFNVTAGEGVTVAPPSGFTAKATTTPRTAFPPESATLRTIGASSGLPATALCLSPLTILMEAATAGTGVSMRTRSLIGSVTKTRPWLSTLRL